MRNRKLRRGTAAVEYSLVAALVIGVIVLAVSTLGEHASRVTSKLANAPSFGSPAPSDLAAKGPAIPAAAAEPVSRWHLAGHVLQLVLALGLVAGISAQAFLSFRKVRQPDPEVAVSALKQPHPLDRLYEKRQDILKDLSQVIADHHLSELRVGQVMTNSLTIVGKSTSVRDLENLLQSERRHHILVTGDDDQLAGIISDRDLSRRNGDCAAEVMTSKITYATPETELIVAATTMISQGISALPVVTENKLIGILTTTDLTLVLQCILLLAKREEACV
jgi:predicted transcriptional regulator/Flp pilus assembly pilin Flp